MHDFWYGLLTFSGIAVSAFLWSRMIRQRTEMVVLYVFGLLGALLGAKVGFVLAELPFILHDNDFLAQLLAGKTVLGALMGGYAGVESGKKLISFTAPTGDTFALVVPASLVLGRLGCVLHGCCGGVVCEPAWWTMLDGTGLSRWPAPWTEAAFNAFTAAVLFALWRRQYLRGQLFHVYLMSYGLFRFAHEFLRESHRITAWLSPYQMLAFILFIFGLIRFLQRSVNHPRLSVMSETVR